MAIELGAAYISILPETSKLAGGINDSLKGAEKSAEKTGKNMGSKMGSGLGGTFKKALTLGGGLLVAAGVTSFFKDSVAAATESNKVMAQTQAVLKSTGGAAGITAKQIGNLAGSIAAKTGMDDEAIQSGENLLLTFTNLRNEQGKGNDIFNQTTAIMTDMSAALGQDTKSSALQLGKALNDPTKGVTALSRVGVSFTEQQKAQIKTLQESGNVLGAQKIILGEVTKEFGGSAEAIATPGARFKVMVGNIQEDLGNVLIPILNKVGNYLIDHVPGWIETAKAAFASIKPTLIDIANNFKSFLGFLSKNRDILIAVAAGLATAKVALVAYNAYVKVSAAVTKGWAVAQKILNGTMKANPVMIVIGVLALLVGALVLAYKRSETFRKIVDKVWGSIKAAVSKAWTGTIKPALTAFWHFIQNTLMPVIRTLFNNVVKPIFKAVAKVIGTYVKVYIAVLKTLWSFMKNVLFPVIKFLWNNVVKPVFAGIGKTISTAWNRVIKPIFTALGTFIRDKVVPAFRSAVDKIGNIWDGLKAAARKPVEFLVNTVYQNGIRAMMNKIPGVNLPSAHFAKGGPVTGGISGKDSVHALMMPGEHVLTAKEVKNAGGHKAILRMRELLANGRFNKMGDLGASTAKGGGHLPRFAKGGSLSPEQIARAQAWAKAQAGKPYIWGGVGPGGFDCSGFMSGITNVLRGGSGYGVRYGTSGSFPWAGFKPGWGEFSVGAFTGSPGHVAGTLGGMNVESTNGSVRVGSAARGAGDPMFTRLAHLGASGNPSVIAAAKAKEKDTSDHWWDIFTEVPKLAKSIFNDIRSMSSSGWFGEFRKAAMSFMDKAVSFGDNKLPDKIPLKYLPDLNLPDTPIRSALKGLGVFDNGGVLKPGQWAYNASNKPEAVFNQQQFKKFADGRGGRQEAPSRYAIHITNWQTGEGYMREIARDEVDSDYAYTNTVRGMNR